MSDERPESLAAQAAAWVPPWERQHRPPDPGYRAHRADDERTSDDEDRSGAGLADDDDDFDESFEGANPPGYAGTVPPELPPIPGEGGGPVSVDAPQELDDEPEREPTDIGTGPELPLPDSIEQAAGGAGEDAGGSPVDAPIPAEGDDAGDVFDAAADDDVSDDDDVDLPFAEEIPDAETDADAETGVERETDADADADAETNADAETDAERETDTDGETGVEGETGTDGEVSAGTGTEVEAADVAYVAGAADFEEAFRAGLTGGEQARAAVPTQARGRRNTPAAPEDAPGRTDEAPHDAPGRTDEAPGSPVLDDAEMAAALEAILLVVDEPVGEMQLAGILEQPAERVARMLEDISARYTAAGHGFDLRRAAGGWRLYTRPEYAAYVERFVLDGQSVRLTQAALETLAVVAYKQPVTRSRISAIRGVNCDGVMRTLVTRGLIEECGTEGETGAYLYRTTPLFLEKLGLNSVDQLPPLAPFLPDDVEEVLDASG